MKTSRRQALGAALLVLALAGCATTGRNDPIPADPVAIDAFEINGRVSVKVKADNKGYPGKLRWQHVGVNEDLWVYTPLGNLVARLKQDAQSAVITDSKGEEYRAGTLAFLAPDVLGYNLPVDALQYWIRGLPWPKAYVQHVARDDTGRLMAMSQDGWQVSYQAWTPGPPPGLPIKLIAENNDMRLNLVIDQWKFSNLERE